MTTTAPNIDSAAVDLWPELGDSKPADSAPEAGVIVAATLAVERSSRALAEALDEAAYAVVAAPAGRAQTAVPPTARARALAWRLHALAAELRRFSDVSAVTREAAEYFAAT